MTQRQRLIWAAIYFGLALGLLLSQPSNRQAAETLLWLAGIAYVAGAWHLIRMFGW